MNVVFSLSLPRVNSEFAIHFPISENVSIMRNFPVVHHFGKLTVNEGFCAVHWDVSQGYQSRVSIDTFLTHDLLWVTLLLEVKVSSIAGQENYFFHILIRITYF